MTRGRTQIAREAPPTTAYERILDLVAAWATVLSLLLLAVGFGLFAALPLLRRNVTFDENALLAGSARPTIRQQSPHAFSAAARLSDTLEPAFRTLDFPAMLLRALADAGLEAHEQRFVVRQPGLSRGELACTNLHVVLRSPRGDGKEAIVLVTPVTLQTFSAGFHQAASGAALAVSTAYALVLHLRSAPWLAKDVVWLVADASCGLAEGVSAWVAQYTGMPGPSNVRPLPAPPDARPFARAGVLQQAFVLEAPAGAVAALGFPLPGTDGQLPRLDAYWLAKYYASAHVGVPHDGDPLPPPPPALAAAAAAVGAIAGPAAGKAALSHSRHLAALAEFAWQQARGIPLGAHAPFKAAGADAATIRLRPPSASHEPALLPGDARTGLAEALELVVRSCSVLVERFHHSMFLYVLAGPRAFVSIERYIGAVVALALVLVLQAEAAKGRNDKALLPNPSTRFLAANWSEWIPAAVWASTVEQA